MYDEKNHEKEKKTYLEIFEQIVNSRIDIERIEPESEDTSFTLSLCVEIFNDRSFVLFERFESGPSVEQVGDESEIEFRGSSDEGCRSEVLAAPDGVGVLKDLQTRKE